MKEIILREKQVESLQKSGLVNPERIREIIDEIIQFYKLDLHNLTVFTEAGSRYFVVTPIIAALAGAKVYAITRDSQYGRREDIKEFTETFAEYCGVKKNITVLYEKIPETIHEADIITNLGFVRPLDSDFIEMMNETAVISYMYETWEYRDGDVDLNACKKKGIPVLGTNESIPGAEVLNFCGHLCAKMLLELDVEIYKSKIIIVSKDLFGPVIWRFLSALGADAYIVKDLRCVENRRYLINCDAVVIADYKEKTPIIGGSGAHISVQELLQCSKRTSVVRFAGNVEMDLLKKHRIPCAPVSPTGISMGKTLADLGPKPVIYLHAAGLKVGEVLARSRLEGMSTETAQLQALMYSPAQDFAETLLKKFRS